MTIGVALLGYGLAGAFFHAPMIAAEPRLRLRRIVTSRAQEVRTRFPDVHVTNDADAVFADPAIDLVVIATPNDTHAPLARDALHAGKHVVVDKPFVTELVDGTALIAHAKAERRVLSVFLNRRWDGDFLTAQALVQLGALGEVALATMHWDRFRPAIKPGWREVPGAGAGLLADLGPHLVDQALRLFGRPDAVGGDILSQRGAARVDDYFELTLHYGTRRVLLGAASLVAAPRPRLALHGSAGSFVKHGLDPQEAHLRAGGSVAAEDYGVDDPADHGTLTDAAGARPVPTTRGDWRHFYTGMAAAIMDAAPPPVDPADALAGLAIIDYARRSAREGRMLTFDWRA